MEKRLAVVISHPTQYYSPWFHHLASQPGLQVKVFYLSDAGIIKSEDKSFKTSFAWDIPLLEGYESEFVENRSTQPGTHHFRGLNNPGASRAIRKWKPDAVLLFGYAYLTHLRLVVSPWLAGVPFLFRGDSHELFPASGWKPLINRWLRNLLFRRFSHFLAVGRANVDYFRRSGVSNSKIGRVPHCVDNSRFQLAAPQADLDATEWKQSLGIPHEAVVVLFAGKLEDKKRPMDLLQAFLNLTKTANASTSVLLFVGSGHLENTLKEASGAETGRRVFFAPFQNQTAMPKVYSVGDVLVLPSFGRGETWGLSVNEAMNLARPAIVSSHVGCGPDLIIPEETGWIFEAGNVEALKYTLRTALSDPARLERMGLRAREHIANYSYERATEALLRVLDLRLAPSVI